MKGAVEVVAAKGQKIRQRERLPLGTFFVHFAVIYIEGVYQGSKESNFATCKLNSSYCKD